MSKLSKIIFFSAMLAIVFFNAGHVLAQNNNTSLPKDSKFIPQCALNNPTGNPESEEECRSISIFVILLLHFSNYLFGIIGALALLFFIYGGFTLILSRGATEQVKKGKDILVAAIVGLIIVFGAYMLVSFLGKAVGLKDYYKIDKIDSTGQTGSSEQTDVMGCCSNSDSVISIEDLDKDCVSSRNKHNRTWAPGPCNFGCCTDSAGNTTKTIESNCGSTRKWTAGDCPEAQPVTTPE